MGLLKSAAVRVALVLIVIAVIFVLAKILRIPQKTRQKLADLDNEFKPAIFVSLLWCILAVGVSYILHRYLSTYIGGKGVYTWNKILTVFVISAILLIPMAAHVFTRRLDLKVVGLSPPCRWRGFLLGIIIVTIFVYLDWLPLKGLLKQPSYALMATIYFFIIAASEELMFRGYLQRISIEKSGVIPGILTAAIIFSLGHVLRDVFVKHQDIHTLTLGFLNYMALALCLAFAAHRTGNIVAPIVMHIAMDLA